MNEYYTVAEYAQVIGKDPGNIRRLLINGIIAGEKMGKQWIIPKDTPYPEDKRIKSGNCRNWRKRASIYKNNPELMKSMSRMCDELSEIYEDKLVKVVMYGSYARGEQTAESDVDIALFLKEDDEKQHDEMIDIVLEHELNQGVTFSVIPIEYANYVMWKKAMPFYQNVDKEGIVLWKAT